jgi:hypothetical protein
MPNNVLNVEVSDTRPNGVQPGGQQTLIAAMQLSTLLPTAFQDFFISIKFLNHFIVSVP